MIEIRKSKIKGRGIFATKPIKKGAKVGEYTGELIPSKEGLRRLRNEYSNKKKFYILSVTTRTDIDATENGGIVRYANHSCNPNCEMVAEGRRAFLYSLKPIKKNQEVTWDYGLQTIGDDKTPCCCGEKNCKGTIES